MSAAGVVGAVGVVVAVVVVVAGDSSEINTGDASNGKQYRGLLKKEI
jgi:hypothetical protein